MSDRLAQNENERAARASLVAVACEMLEGTLPFIEGAVEVLRLRGRIGGVAEFDEDFMTFVAIESETDHLPLKAQWPLWDTSALENLASEFESVQTWANAFAPASCRNLIARFANG